MKNTKRLDDILTWKQFEEEINNTGVLIEGCVDMTTLQLAEMIADSKTTGQCKYVPLITGNANKTFTFLGGITTQERMSIDKDKNFATHWFTLKVMGPDKKPANISFVTAVNDVTLANGLLQKKSKIDCKIVNTEGIPFDIKDGIVQVYCTDDISRQFIVKSRPSKSHDVNKKSKNSPWTALGLGSVALGTAVYMLGRSSQIIEPKKKAE